MKLFLLGSTKSKITKDESGKNVPHLDITEVELSARFKSLVDICSK